MRPKIDAISSCLSLQFFKEISTKFPFCLFFFSSSLSLKKQLGGFGRVGFLNSTSSLSRLIHVTNVVHRLKHLVCCSLRLWTHVSNVDKSVPFFLFFFSNFGRRRLWEPFEVREDSLGLG